MVKRRRFILTSLGLLATGPAAFAQMPIEPTEPAELPADQEPRPQVDYSSIQAGATVYISPDGAGIGTSWSDAAPITAINELISRVGAGGTILLQAEGAGFDVAEALHIDAGGTMEAPVTISGADRSGAPAPATLRGTRTKWVPADTVDGAVDASDFGGNTLFILSKGAGFLGMANLDVFDFGCVVDMSGHKASGLTIEDVRFTNIRDGIYTDDASGISDVVIRRFSGRGFSKKAVRFHGRCSNWLIEDCDLDSAWQYGDNFAVGIEAHDQAHGLHILGGSTRNTMDTQGDDQEQYWNGDGVASERGNSDILIENHHSSGNTDGGYDLKSESTVLRNCVTEDNKRNFRLWGGIGAEPMVLEGCSSRSPRKRGGSGGTHHIWLSGASESGDDAGSILYVNGVLAGGGADEVIHADGGNAAVHLVDTDTTGLPVGGELFTATVKTSKLIVGSVRDTGATAILGDAKVTLIAKALKTMTLEADADVSWRIASVEGDVTGHLSGDKLTLEGDDAGTTGRLVIQARDSRGFAIRKDIGIQTVENPVAPGAVFSLAFDTVAGKVSLIDATGMHVIRVSEGRKVVDQAFVFDGKKSYFELDPSANFSFDGAFAIVADIQLDEGVPLPADIITVWKTSGHQRSFRLGVDEGGAVSFYWSTDGRSDDANVLTGPVLDSERMSKVIVDRGDSGILRLYVDGTMVARSSGPVQEFFASNSPLRVSGRSDGKQAAMGKLGGLTVVKGYARCDSDDGCPMP